MFRKWWLVDLKFAVNKETPQEKKLENDVDFIA